MIDENNLIRYIKGQINPYGKPFTGTAYDFGLKIMSYIENMEEIGEWIPCSERLPGKEMDTDEDGLATVETTVILPNGELTTFIDDYMFNTGEFCTPYQVIAWRERPEPYHPEEVIKQTNADRIRSMTNEKLAEWIHNITQYYDEEQEPTVSIYDLDTKKDTELHDSYGDLLKWLQSEVEEQYEHTRIEVLP